MLRLYKYLFYRQYYLNLRDWNNDRVWALMSAIGAVAAVVLFQLFALIWFLQVITGITFLEYIVTINPVEYLIALLALFALVTVFFISGGQYKKILKEFDDLKETDKQKLRGEIRLWIFVIVSCLLWLVPASLSLLRYVK